MANAKRTSSELEKGPVLSFSTMVSPSKSLVWEAFDDINFIEK
jgi:hypothetical protein